MSLMPRKTMTRPPTGRPASRHSRSWRAKWLVPTFAAVAPLVAKLREVPTWPAVWSCVTQFGKPARGTRE
jgi:hypothetical protein